MAHEVGTANNLEDLFGKIVSFLTTNATLVAANQEWEVLRLHRDNIAAYTTNLTEPTVTSGVDAPYRRSIQTFRYDPRSLNTDDENAERRANFYATNFSSGVSHVTWQFRTAREVKTVRLRAPLYNSHLSSMLRNFRLQYSDDGSTWTTALTVNASTPFSLGEVRDYAVPGTPGSHLHWRILMDSVQSGSRSVSWMSMLLLEADGTVANHFGSEVIFKARGNSGTEAIYTGIRCEYDATVGWYNLFLNGYTGFDPNEQSWFKQPGALNGYGMPYTCAVPMVPCWDNTMPYWFAASGRSFRFAVKVSTNYEAGYLGYILPYATPGQFPYPLAVGGSLVPQTSNRGAEWRYSYVSSRHGCPAGPGVDDTPNREGRWATLYMRNPDGEWSYFGNRGSQSESIYGPTQSYYAPYVPDGAWRCVWPHAMNDQWSSGKLPYRECLGGGYLLQPCILMQRAPYPAVFGELEGTYVISGFGNSPENTTTWNGKTVVVFQNAYRNTVHEFWAMSLD